MSHPCTCGATDVAATDHAEHQSGFLVVHGERHCFTTPSAIKLANPVRQPDYAALGIDDPTGRN